MRSTLEGLAEKIADAVYYGYRGEQNVIAESNETQPWICFIDEINTGSGTSGDSHVVSFPTSFAFVKLVELEGSSVENDELMQDSYKKCTEMLNSICKSGSFAKLPAWGMAKVQENEYDLNFIGWRINIDLTPVDFSGVC